MKMLIEWHEGCLKNQKSHLNKKKLECERLIDEILRLEVIIGFYSNQIELAKKKGLFSFDSERLGIKRTKKEK